MGIFNSIHSKTSIYLKPVHIFGRDSNTADTVISHQGSSRLHCVLRWQAGHWFVTDESKNGCFINGKRIEKGHSLCLAKGDVFSTCKNNSAAWTFEDESAPKPIILNKESSRWIELEPLNILPDENTPECQIVQQGQHWFFEKDHEHVSISEGFSFLMEGKHWHFFPNFLLQETEYVADQKREIPEIIFDVSRNEEHVGIIFRSQNEEFNLGRKIHHYLILELARHRLEDSDAQESDRGWMSNDLVLHRLGIDMNHLNIQIYRARKAIKEYSQNWSQHLIERRRGEMRLHECKIEINKGY
ncbi:FHA domain-containing protein [Aliikangiella coralliicola]|uniref:FHA domain-containing protein n=1 Tax=Aliikangiella coralliicola TaxID=2592383 RepID=A0A545UEY5_9GAMM|nr:FHA domain-containing protein [Aliikangiella coralliicola]TQV88041.1 FHA domain-containing protein [Aliikangiella coralliicola]